MKFLCLAMIISLAYTPFVFSEDKTLLNELEKEYGCKSPMFPNGLKEILESLKSGPISSKTLDSINTQLKDNSNAEYIHIRTFDISNSKNIKILLSKQVKNKYKFWKWEEDRSVEPLTVHIKELNQGGYNVIFSESKYNNFDINVSKDHCLVVRTPKWTSCNAIDIFKCEQSQEFFSKKETACIYQTYTTNRVDYYETKDVPNNNWTFDGCASAFSKDNINQATELTKGWADSCGFNEKTPITKTNTWKNSGIYFELAARYYNFCIAKSNRSNLFNYIKKSGNDQLRTNSNKTNSAQ